MSSRVIAVSLALFSLFPIATASWAAGRPDLVRDAVAKNVQHMPSELLVQFYAGFDLNAQTRALARVQGQIAEVITTSKGRNDNRGDLVRVKLPVGLAIQDALDRLGLETIIEYAEPNWVYQHQATSNDPYVTNGSLWGMTGTYGSGASTAWANNKTDCSAVYIGIIDEGYMNTHEDLAANAGTNTSEIANGIDDDGNGLIDDIYGWDFANNDKTTFDGLDDDHGTHVAGTIAGVGANGKGVAGVCWNLKLLSAKFLGKSGGTTANAIKAVDYFTNLKTRTLNPLNIVATNNSWGGGGYSQALKDAIDRAGTASIMFVAAAGNSGTNNDTTASYPSNYASANVIAVAAIDSAGQLANFSQYGATTVHLGAPGVAIVSSVPVRSSKSVVSGYASYSGTSMATPHVTGAVALYKALNPTASLMTVKSAILNATVPTMALSGKTITGGRLNVSGF